MNGAAGSDYERAGGVLILTAVILLLVAVLTNRGDLTSATLILCGVGSFVTGLFILTFSRNEPFDRRIAALLPVQGQIEICTMCADLGLHGTGYLLPPSDKRNLTHFIPVAEFHSPVFAGESIFIIERDGNCGVSLIPAGAPLLAHLEMEHGLVIPADETGLLVAIQEVLETVLELGDQVSVFRSGETIVVTITGYHLIEGCEVVKAQSPKCCTTYPCPVCSLIACLLSRGTGKVVTLEQVDGEDRNLRLVYAFALL